MSPLPSFRQSDLQGQQGEATFRATSIFQQSFSRRAGQSGALRVQACGARPHVPEVRFRCLRRGFMPRHLNSSGFLEAFFPDVEERWR